MSDWYTLFKGGIGEYEEKKSRFIATIEPVSSEEEASAFITGIRKKYFDARHNCSAYIIGDNGQKTRCSDDGEPSGTAGRPMLEVLSGAHITNACVVVTRYFGGTLLGTGGLVRAYTQAVKEALEHCEKIIKLQGFRIDVSCDYNDFEKIRYMAGQKGYNILDVNYGQNVCLSMVTDDADSLIKDVTDLTAGRATCPDPEPLVYAMIDGKARIME